MSASHDHFQAADRAFWSYFGLRPTERRLNLNSGLTVRIQEIGEGPPALFVHGAMTAGSNYASLVDHLQNFRCILPDRSVCGLSETWQLQAEFRNQAVNVLNDTLDALQLDSVLLVGNSLGGIWSVWFSLVRPMRVSGLAVLGPSIGFAGVRPPPYMRIAAIPGIGALIRRRIRPSRESLPGGFSAMGHGKSIEAGKIPAEFFDWQTNLWTDTKTLQNDLEAVHRAVGFTGARGWIQLTGDELRTLSVPTLLLTRTDDSHGGLSVASRASELIPNCQVEILTDAGHLPWLDEPEVVAQSLRRFAHG